MLSPADLFGQSQPLHLTESQEGSHDHFWLPSSTGQSLLLAIQPN